MKSNIISFREENKKELKFFFLFIIIFLIGNLLITFKMLQPFIINNLTAYPVFKIINFITPGENVRIENNTVITGSVSMNVKGGCEGTHGILILISALIAFPMSGKDKFYGIVFGTFIIYFFNLIRISGLYYILKYNPSLFDLMHMYIGQTITIFMGVIFFVSWLERTKKQKK